MRQHGCHRGHHTKRMSQKKTYDITYMCNLKYGTNEPIYKTETDSQRTGVVAKGQREGEGWTGSLGLVDANYYV